MSTGREAVVLMGIPLGWVAVPHGYVVKFGLAGILSSCFTYLILELCVNLRAKTLKRTMETLASRATVIREQLSTKDEMHGKIRKKEVKNWLADFESLTCEVDDVKQKIVKCGIRRLTMRSRLDKLISEATRLHECWFHEGLTLDVDKTKGCESDGIVDGDRVGWRSPPKSEATGGSGGRIRGLRPPVRASQSVMAPPVVDNVCSTGDLFRSFGPQDDQIGHRNSPVGPLPGDGWVDNGDDEKLDQQRIKRRKRALDSCPSVSIEVVESEYKDDGEPVHNVSSSGNYRRTITSWQQGRLLGSGSFGTVYVGFADDGFSFAVKEVSLSDPGSRGRQSVSQLEKEIRLLSQFEHENIVQYLGTYKDDKKLYIFLELLTKGSLSKLYQEHELGDSKVSTYTRQILLGLKYLHDRKVVHRDIKCANILVGASGSVKLADFGLAKATEFSDARTALAGTAFWMAPEVFNPQDKSYGLAADIWSLGCTVLEMLTRKHPYPNLEWVQALYKIGNGEPPEVPDYLSRDARDFILKCLQVNLDDRPTAVQLLDRPFVR